MHRPVLLNEVIEIFDPKPGQKYIDATVNGGGHAKAILEKIGPSGILIGIDRDCELINKLRIRNQELGIRNVTLICDNYANIGNIARSCRLGDADGILFDLGVSSYHFESSGRGFSFMKDEPLDMRFNPKDTAITAAIFVNQAPQEKIESILRQYGEERFAKRIAAEISKERRHKKIETTADLVSVIKKAVPRWYCRGRRHCATRTFQALRIAVNDELASLEKAIRAAIGILGNGGKLLVISFHSLEDRIVKDIFREAAKSKEVTKISKKVIKPTYAEILENPRARSAKLRGVQKL